MVNQKVTRCKSTNKIFFKKKITILPLQKFFKLSSIVGLLFLAKFEILQLLFFFLPCRSIRLSLFWRNFTIEQWCHARSAYRKYYSFAF